jgi:hypothetical protein
MAAIKRLGAAEPLSGEAARALKLLNDVVDTGLTFAIRYDPQVVADFLHADLPGKDRPVESLRVEVVRDRLVEIEKAPGIEQILAWKKANPDRVQSLNLKPTFRRESIFDILRDKRLIESREGTAARTATVAQKPRAKDRQSKPS